MGFSGGSEAAPLTADWKGEPQASSHRTMRLSSTEHIELNSADNPSDYGADSSPGLQIRSTKAGTWAG